MIPGVRSWYSFGSSGSTVREARQVGADRCPCHGPTGRSKRLRRWPPRRSCGHCGQLVGPFRTRPCRRRGKLIDELRDLRSSLLTSSVLRDRPAAARGKRPQSSGASRVWSRFGRRFASSSVLSVPLAGVRVTVNGSPAAQSFCYGATQTVGRMRQAGELRLTGLEPSSPVRNKCRRMRMDAWGDPDHILSGL
jgi:hypothetical protein